MLRFLVVALIVVFVPAGAVARADVDDVSGTNVQEGDNGNTTRQGGSGRSGDAVGGQVSGVVSSGRTSVDARNRSVNSDVSTGDADGNNTSRSFVGHASSDTGSIAVGADVSDACANVGSSQTDACANVQHGDNRLTTNQSATASTGDGVAGGVIGVVTAAGGSASVVADNLTQDSSADTGDADAANDATAFVGLASVDVGEIGIGVADVDGACAGTGSSQTDACINVQDGDNRSTNSQAATAGTGDGIVGQVIGAVSAGATSIDARNRTLSSDAETGDADAANDATAFVGLASNDVGDIGVGAADVDGACSGVGSSQTDACINVQHGDNRATNNQRAAASTGDGVAGGVIGVVTSAGGSTSVVADNLTEDSSADTGDADAFNDATAFVGLGSVDVGGFDVADVDGACAGTGSSQTDACINVQDGDNRSTNSQAATAGTGDGIVGQVVGAVSAGATSIDARNRTLSSDAETGDADAANDATAFVGLASNDVGDIGVGAADVDGACADVASSQTDGCVNVQHGDNRATNNQRATANSGDGVAGGVIGVVTSAGGSASVVADNLTQDSSADTGDADAANDATAFVGLASVDVGTLEVADVDGACAGTGSSQTDACINVQDGDNRSTNSQAATASSGDGIVGQVIGAVSAGATSIDARNRTLSSDASTGDADAANDATAFVGLASNDVGDIGVGAADVDGACSGVGSSQTDACINVQHGDNRASNNQRATANTGDGVAGGVIGVVTSAGGSASVVADNLTQDSSADTGDADAFNDATAFVGLGSIDIGTFDVADVDGACAGTGSSQTDACINVQDGDNRSSNSQAATASTGDGIVGQVIGAVSAGATSIDARNRTLSSDASTGDADAANDATAFVGLGSTDVGEISVSDVDGACSGVGSSQTDACHNVQDGNNRATNSQSALATSGDAVAGQVSGVVTSAGGSASVVVDNTSDNIAADTGDSDFSNDYDQFVGLVVAGSIVV